MTKLWTRLLPPLLAFTLIVPALPIFGAGVTQARAQADSQLFPETGKTVSGKFLDYWKANGGLAQQGYPISEEMQEKSDTDGKTYTVQYFERAVFELHPENQPPYDVLLSLLGVFAYNQKYPNGAPNQVPSDAPDKRIFPETGKTVGGEWLDYWNAHGGLAQQGLPISEIFEEKSDLDGKTYAVQYFERAVFELHPENQPPYNILLSQLGTFHYRARYLQPPVTPTTLPTPGPPTPTPLPAAGLADFVWRSTGAPDNFKNAAGIATDKQGNVYVVDAGNARIRKLGPSGSQVTMWGSDGTADGQFKFHDDTKEHGGAIFGDVAVDGQGNVYVADMGNRRVQKFDSTGKFLLKWGSEGTGDGQFRSAGSIAVDGDGNVYVGDDIAISVQKFDPTGKFLARIGSVGVGEGQFASPAGMAFDAQGNLYLADYENHRISIFTKDGQFLRMFGTRGLGDGQFRHPVDVAVDGQGNIYVINDDPNLNFVQKFDNTGRYIGKFGEGGIGDGKFDALFGLALDSHGSIYVSDIDLNTAGAESNVQKFRLK
jgi:sugar lactone lactonase YvrE